MKIQDIQYILEKFDVEGFELQVGAYSGAYIIKIPKGSEHGLWLINNLVWRTMYYPLFLQRTIEAINKKYLNINFPHKNKRRGYYIEWCVDSFIVMGQTVEGGSIHEEIEFFLKDNPDQAKEQAILYIINKLRSEG